jgi:hypothetical protein
LADALAPARHADATGWDGVYIANHFMGDGGGGPFPLTAVRWMPWIWSVP